MSDNRTMNQRGFIELPDMTDHQFAQFVKRHDLTYRQHLIGAVWTDKNGDSFAVITYDNENCSRRIFIKESRVINGVHR